MTACLLLACGRTEKMQDTAGPSGTAADAGAVAAPRRRNCQSVVAADQLNKPLEYKETAKPITVTLTLNVDTSTVDAGRACYVNNTVTVQTARKSGKQLFKRTLLKDDLLYFVDNDEAVKRSVLQKVTYKPTFNGERYFNLTMRLIEPGSQKTLEYTLFVNYFGEIVKVK